MAILENIEQDLEKTEFVQVSVKIPKRILEWYRMLARVEKKTVEDMIAFEIVDNTRADIEDLNGAELIDLLKLCPIFRENLSNERYAENSKN